MLGKSTTRSSERRNVNVFGEVERVLTACFSASPDAVNEDFDVYTGNTRDITMLDWTPEKGKAALKVAFVSIGALLVGANRFTNAEQGAEYKRGQEMGYFAYGGSTCIAIFPPEAKIKWDDDLMSNSRNSVSMAFVTLHASRATELTISPAVLARDARQGQRAYWRLASVIRSCRSACLVQPHTRSV